MADDLPNLGILIKLLKMTTSSNDAEALVACRKANEALVKFGGDWESLLRGKVTVIGDPFADPDLAQANAARNEGRSGYAPASRYAPTPPKPRPRPQPYTPPPQPQAAPQSFKNYGKPKRGPNSTSRKPKTLGDLNF